MIKSIFEINNKIRKLKFKEIVKTLFPEFKIIRIKKSGIVILKKHWYSIFKSSIHVSELCTTELPRRLSFYRQGDQNYTPIYNAWLGQIIYDLSGNVIDWLYLEFLKVKKESKLENIISNSSLLLPEANSKYETINDVLENKDVSRIRSKEIKRIKKCYETLMKESIIDKLERVKFLRRI